MGNTASQIEAFEAAVSKGDHGAIEKVLPLIHPTSRPAVINGPGSDGIPSLIYSASKGHLKAAKAVSDAAAASSCGRRVT